MLNAASLRKKGTMGRVVRVATESGYSSKCAAIEAEITRLQKAVRTMSKELDRSAGVNKQNSDLKSIINERLGEIGELKARIEMLTKDHASDLRRVIEEKRSVEARLTALTAEKDGLESSSAESAAQLAAVIKETNAKVDELTRQLETSKEQNDASVDSQAQKTKVYSLTRREKRHRSTELKVRLTELLARSIRSEHTIRRLRAQAQIKLKAQLEYRDAIRDKITELDRIKQKSSNDTRTIDNLRKLNDTLSSQLDKSNTELVSLDALYRESTEGKDRKISALNANLANLSEEVSALKREAANKDARANELEVERVTLQSQLDGSKALCDELTRAMGESGSKKDSEISRLKAAYEEERNKVAELESRALSLDHAISEEKQEARVVADRIARTESFLASVTVIMRDAARDRGDLLQELSGARRTIKTQVDEIQHGLMKVQILGASASRSREALEQLTRENSGLKLQLIELKGEVDRLRGLLASGTKKEEIRALKGSLNEATDRIHTIQAEIRDRDGRLLALQQDLTETKARHAEEINILNQKLAASVSDSEDVKTRLHNLSNELQAEQLSKRKALEEVSRVTREVESHSTTSQALRTEIGTIEKELANSKRMAEKANNIKDEIERAKVLLETTVQRLQNELRDTKAKAQQDVETAKERAAECESRNRELELQLTASKKSQSEMEASTQNTLTAINASLEEERRKSAALTSRVSELDADLQKARLDVAQSKEYQVRADTELQRIMQINSDLQQEAIMKDRIIESHKSRRSERVKEQEDTSLMVSSYRVRAASPEKLVQLEQSHEASHNKILKDVADQRVEQSTIDMLRTENTRLGKQVLHLEHELGKLETKRNKMAAKISSLESSLSALDAKVRSQDAEIKSLTKSGEESRVQLGLNDQEMKRLEQNAAEKSLELSTCEVRLATSQREVEDTTLSKRASELLLKKSNEAMAKLKKEIGLFTELSVCEHYSAPELCAKSLGDITKSFAELCDTDDPEELMKCTERLKETKRALLHIEGLQQVSKSSASNNPVPIERIIEAHLEREVSASTHDIQSRLETAWNTNKKLQESLAVKSSDVKSKDEFIHSINQQLVEKDLTISEMQRLQDKLTAAMSQLNERNTLLESEMSAMKETLRNGLAAAQAEAELARQQNNSKVTSLEESNRLKDLELAVVQRALETNRKEMNKLQSDIEEKIKEHGENGRKITELEGLKSTLESKLNEHERQLDKSQSKITELEGLNSILESKLKQRDDSNDTTLASIIQLFVNRMLEFRTGTIGELIDEAGTYDEVGRTELIGKFTAVRSELEEYIDILRPQLQESIKRKLQLMSRKIVLGSFNLKPTNEANKSASKVNTNAVTKRASKANTGRSAPGNLDSASARSVGSNEERAGKSTTRIPAFGLLRDRLRAILTIIKDRSWINKRIPALIRLKRQVDEYQMSINNRELLSRFAAFTEEPDDGKRWNIGEDIRKLLEGQRASYKDPVQGSLEEYIMGLEASEYHSISDADLKMIMRSDDTAIELMQSSELDSTILSISEVLEAPESLDENVLAKMILMTHLIDLIKSPPRGDDQDNTGLTIVLLKSVLLDSDSSQNEHYKFLLDDIRQELESQDGTDGTLAGLKKRILSLIDEHAPRVQPEAKSGSSDTNKKIDESLLKFQTFLDQRKAPDKPPDSIIPSRPMSALPRTRHTSFGSFFI
jgi:chromosome segregation ATPase